MGTCTPAMSTVRGCSILDRVDGVLVWAAVAGFALVSAELGGAASRSGAACGDTLASVSPKPRVREATQQPVDGRDPGLEDDSRCSGLGSARVQSAKRGLVHRVVQGEQPRWGLTRTPIHS